MLIDSFTKTSRTSRIAVCVSLVAIMSIFAYDWLVAPKAKQLQAASGYEMISDDINAKIKLLQNSTKVKTKRIEKLTKELAKYEAVLMTDQQTSEFFGSLESYADYNGCIFKSLRFIDEVELYRDIENNSASGVIRKDAVLEFLASYESAVNFLVTLSFNEAVDLGSLFISSKDDSKLLTCRLKISCYSLKARPNTDTAEK